MTSNLYSESWSSDAALEEYAKYMNQCEKAGNNGSLCKEDGIEYPFYPVPWPEGTELFCKFCNLTYNNSTQFGQHLENGRHRMNVRKAEIQRLQEARDPRVFCSFCNLALHPTPMRDHLVSLKHLLKKDKEGCLTSEESEVLAAAKSKQKLRSRRSKDSMAPHAQHNLKKNTNQEANRRCADAAQHQHLSATETTAPAQLLQSSSSAGMPNSVNILSNFPDMVYAYLPQHLLFSLLGPVGAIAAIKSAEEKMASLAQGYSTASCSKPMDVQTPSNVVKKSVFSCSICNVECSSAITMNNHLDGYSHAKKAGPITIESKHWPRLQKERSSRASLKNKFAEKRKEKQAAKRLKLSEESTVEPIVVSDAENDLRTT